MKRATMAKYGIPAKAEALMAHFGRDAFRLSPEEWAFIRGKAFDRDYFFIANREDRQRQRGWCSHCRKWQMTVSYSPERLGHNDTVKCPECGAELTVKHAWRMSMYLEDEALVYLYRPSVLDPAIVTARAVDVCRPWGICIEPHKLQERVLFDSFYVFTPGEGGQMLRPVNSAKVFWATFWAGEVARKTDGRFGMVYELAARPAARDAHYTNTYMGMMRRIEISVAADSEGAFRAAEHSPLRYGMKEYSRYEKDHFLGYWHWAARYPSVEKLVKIGLGQLIANKMRGRREYGDAGNVINWRGKDLTAILRGRLTKADKVFLLEHGDLVSQEDVVWWQLYEGKRSMAEAVAIRDCNLAAWKRIHGYIDLDRARCYLEKQARKLPKGLWDNLGATLYADYLGECVKLGYDMTDKAVLFPKDFRKEHEHTMKLVKYQENRDIEDAYAKGRRPEMTRRYGYEAMGMAVIVPERLSDLIVEGERQHNCVGGYMDRVAKGQTDVVFIRRLAKPEESYITMEIHQGRIIQARTKNNGPLDKAGERFVEAFRMAKLEKKKARKTA
ncbi:MAG: PcfJ domain-containing protein [Schwartzia sp.]|nr:PcfJ domain-containing protein [Schwartzia sp. (in: firmicutes)]